MKSLISRTKIFSSFWLVLACYFIIPVFVDSISPPKWFYYIDYRIPFLPWMIIPYYIYYVIILLPPLIWHSDWEIRNITSTLNMMSIFCYTIFILWPISTNHIMDNLIIDSFGILHNFITYDYLFQNAFPSMHVCVSTFLCLVYNYDFDEYNILSIIIGLLIFSATFLIKQHYLFDSVFGLLIGLSGFYYYKTKKLIYLIHAPKINNNSLEIE